MRRLPEKPLSAMHRLMPLLHAGNQQAEDEQRRRSQRRIAKWVTRLLGTADLTPSDSAVALVLVATLQRQARK